MARLKTIDTWRLQIPTGTTHPNQHRVGPAQIPDTVTVAVPVKINPHNSETYFEVEHEYGPHRYRDKDTDINALRERTRAWLTTVVSFVWEDFLFVQFRGAKPPYGRWPSDEHKAAHRSLEIYFTYKHYQIGTNNAGAKVYRDLTGTMQCGAVVQGLPDTTGPERGVLVPKTPENEAALRAITDGFVALSTKLYDLLHPDRIQATLQSVNLQQLNLTHIPTNDPPAQAAAAKPKRRSRDADHSP